MASLDGAAAAPRASRTTARWIGFSTIVRREYGRIVRIWSQTLLPSAVTTTLYFVIFANLLGRRIGVIDGVDYRLFIAPGLILMQVIQNSYGNVVSSFFGAKFGKHVEELLVSPLPNWLIVAGYAAGGVVRGAMVAVVVAIVAMVFARLHVEHPLVVVAATLLTSIVFSLGGFINAIFARNFDQVNWIPVFILGPLSYFGGVFYSVSMLPGWAQKVSLVNPILYMVNAVRYGFLGVSDVPLAYAFPFMVALAAVLFGVSVGLLARGSGTRD